MDFQELAQRSGEWLRGAGPESDIAMSCRIRLARNLASHPFISKATEQDRDDVQKKLRRAVESVAKNTPLDYLDVARLASLDRQLLVERQLISRELSEAAGARSVAVDTTEQVSLMINEEDHLRLQVIHSGLDLDAAWQQISHIDDLVESQVTYAYSDRLGYLTACPTNVGTGMRVSVMLHLPALVMTQQVEKVFRSLQKIGLAVRGLYGEGSQAMGDFYQISNQITLGLSEEALIRKVQDVMPRIIEGERKARQHLIKDGRDLHDRISRHYGILRSAQKISSEETMHLLSSVRMGINLQLIDDLDIGTVNLLFIHTQPAHLQKLAGGELGSGDRNVERARYLRNCLERNRRSEKN